MLPRGVPFQTKPAFCVAPCALKRSTDAPGADPYQIDALGLTPGVETARRSPLLIGMLNWRVGFVSLKVWIPGLCAGSVRCGVEVVSTLKRPPPSGWITEKRRGTAAESFPVFSFTERMRPLRGAAKAWVTPVAFVPPSEVFQNSASAAKVP